jgi:hypothetical protein
MTMATAADDIMVMNEKQAFASSEEPLDNGTRTPSTTASVGTGRTDLQSLEFRLDMTNAKSEKGALQEMKNVEGLNENMFIDHEGYEKLTPKFWTGTSAIPLEKIVVDGSQFDFTKILEKNENGGWSLLSESDETKKLQAALEERFVNTGVFLLRSTALKAMDPAGGAMALIPDLLAEAGRRYVGGSNHRGNLAPNVFDTGAPLSANLHYHHEMEYVADSIETISFMGISMPKSTSGATYVSDSVAVTKEILATPLGQKLKEKGICYVRKLPDLDHFRKNPDTTDSRLVFNYWQTSFETDCPIEAEKVAKSQGLEVEWVDSPIFGRYMLTKFYISAFEFCPYTKKNLLYAGIGNSADWFDSWPVLMDLVPEERPMELWFGDDTPSTREERKQLMEVHDNHGIPIDWQEGDVAMICNRRFAHGRPAINIQPGENRKIGVKLGKGFKRQGDTKQGWTTWDNESA